jgi:hypothetical protein
MKPQRFEDFAEHDLVSRYVLLRDDLRRQDISSLVDITAEFAELVPDRCERLRRRPERIFVERQPHTNRLRNAFRADGHGGKRQSAQGENALRQIAATGQGHVFLPVLRRA